MRYNAEHKQKTREAILHAAGRMFRAEGYGGSGIDGLTREAGVTNGAFYGHFRTKAEAFQEIVAISLRQVAEGITQMQAEHGDGWLAAFVDYSLGPKQTCGLGEACPLAMLSAEVARADDAAREAYGAAFRTVVTAAAAGLDGDETRAQALLALMSGVGTLARALPDSAARASLADAVRGAALAFRCKP